MSVDNSSTVRGSSHGKENIALGWVVGAESLKYKSGFAQAGPSTLEDFSWTREQLSTSREDANCTPRAFSSSVVSLDSSTQHPTIHEIDAIRLQIEAMLPLEHAHPFLVPAHPVDDSVQLPFTTAELSSPVASPARVRSPGRG